MAEFGDPRVKGRGRSILSTLLVSRSGLRPAEVARYLGVSRSAVAKSTRRSDQALASDPGLSRRLRLITARILEKERGEA